MRLALLPLVSVALFAGEAAPTPTTPPAPAPTPTTAPAPTATAPAAARPYLGIAIDPVASTLDGKGQVILRVEPNSPAAVMGLIPSDRILSIDGIELKPKDDLAAIITAKKPGDAIKLSILRAKGKDGLPQELQINGVLQESPRSRTASLSSQLTELQGRLGELAQKNKDPTLGEVLQKLQDIERDLPRAAAEFKKVYPNGQFRIAISLEISSDTTAKDPLNLDVSGTPEQPQAPAPAPEAPKAP